MMFLLNGNDKKTKKKKDLFDDAKMKRIREVFLAGKFPVVTTESIEHKLVSKVLGLVACRGYDSEEAFYGMTARAVSKGAEGIVAYKECVAFHPDGSKFFSCYGTAVQFEKPKGMLLPAIDQTALDASHAGRNRSGVPIDDLIN